jgi:hypothetical protein
MPLEKAVETTHPEGEVEKAGPVAELESCTVDTYAGKLRIRWDESAAVTGVGQMPVLRRRAFTSAPSRSSMPFSSDWPSSPSSAC